MQGEYLLIMSFVVSNFSLFLHSCSCDRDCLRLEMEKIYRVITQVPCINFHILGYGISIYQISGWQF